jgi:hypothetical protein
MLRYSAGSGEMAAMERPLVAQSSRSTMSGYGISVHFSNLIESPDPTDHPSARVLRTGLRTFAHILLSHSSADFPKLEE